MKYLQPKYHLRLFKMVIPLVLILAFTKTSVDHGFWHFGTHHFKYHNNDTSLEYTFDDESLLEFPCLNGVGGVALTTTAEPESSLTFNSISLNYNPNNVDGQRLVVNVDGIDLIHNLPDWMLFPIAKFADSEYNAAVSLFGPETEPCPGGFKYHITYHTEFSNTLLGLRLLHSDALFTDLNQFWKVPKWEGDNLDPVEIIAPSEDIPSGLTYWIPGANSLSDDFAASDVAGETYQSWLLTDLGEHITFNFVQDELVFSGLPYYYFWDADANFSVSEVSLLTELVREDLEESEAYQTYNPFVYDAVIQTTRYAAFFRYIKLNYPSTWDSFLNEIQSLEPEPAIVTPSVWQLCDDPTSVVETDLPGEILLYPNPVIDIVTIDFSENISDDLTVNLLSLSGRKVLKQFQFPAGSTGNLELNLSSLPAGIYFIEFSAGQQTSYRKIIKK